MDDLTPTTTRSTSPARRRRRRGAVLAIAVAAGLAGIVGLPDAAHAANACNAGYELFEGTFAVPGAPGAVRFFPYCDASGNGYWLVGVSSLPGFIQVQQGSIFGLPVLYSNNGNGTGSWFLPHDNDHIQWILQSGGSAQTYELARA